MEPQTVITLLSIVKRFPEGEGFFTALNNISLSVDKGEFVGLVGPSG